MAVDPSRRAWYAGGAAVISGAVVIGYRSYRAPEPAPAPAEAGSPPASPGSVQAPQPENHLFGAAGPASPKDMEFGQLMDLLDKAAKQPAVAPLAGKFEKAFNARPELSATFQKFQKAPASARASAFFQQIREAPAFQKIASDFLSQPGGAQAFAATASFGQLKPFFKQLVQTLPHPSGASRGAGRSMGARPVDLADFSREWALKARGPAAGSASPAPASPGSSPGADGSLGGAGAASSDAGDPSAGSSDNNASSPGGYDVSTSLQGAGSPSNLPADEALRQWLGTYFGSDAATIWSGIGQYGLWGSCFKAGDLAKCVTACQSPPVLPTTSDTINCGLPQGPYPYWQACLDAKYSPSQCLRQCAAQSPPCVLDPSVVNQLCTVPAQNHQAVDPNCPSGYRPGDEAWQCKAIEKKLFSDGRCYLGGGGACCSSGPHWGGDCDPATAWQKQPCACQPSDPSADPSSAASYPCGRPAVPPRE